MSCPPSRVRLVIVIVAVLDVVFAGAARTSSVASTPEAGISAVPADGFDEAAGDPAGVVDDALVSVD